METLESKDVCTGGKGSLHCGVCTEGVVCTKGVVCTVGSVLRAWSGSLY